jgi:hypothetical protein
MANGFQNFLAGRQLANAEREAAANQQQNEFQNQLLMARENTSQGELALKQAQDAREVEYNQLASKYLGQEAIGTLGFPQRQQAPAYQVPTGNPYDEESYAQQRQQQAQPVPNVFSQLVGMDPKRALELQAAKQKQQAEVQNVIYSISNRALSSKSPSASLKHILQADQIGPLNIKQFREQLSEQGIDVNSLDDDGARDLLQVISDQSGVGVQPGTDDLKEYEYARSQGETRDFSDWLTGMKRAGAANTNVNLPGNKYPNAFQEGLAKSDVARLEKYQQSADAAASLKETIDTLSQLNETALQGGKAESRLEIANWLQGVTGIDVIDPEVLVDSQKYNALISRAMLDSLGGSLGPGVSNSDVAFIKQTVPQLSYSRKAREDLLARMKAIADKKITLYERARQYGEEKGGLKGFDSGGINSGAKNQPKDTVDYSKMSDDDVRRRAGF